MKYRIRDKKSGKFIGEGGLFSDPKKAYLFDTHEEAEAEVFWILQHAPEWLPNNLQLTVCHVL